MSGELNNLRPGDRFLVDFGNRRDSQINDYYLAFRNRWLTVAKNETEPNGETKYRAVAPPDAPAFFDEMRWRPVQDFSEIQRVPIQPAVHCKRELPDI